jgi:hypothetical protein
MATLAEPLARRRPASPTGRFIGRLFREKLRTPFFDAMLREELLDAFRHDW